MITAIRNTIFTVALVAALGVGNITQANAAASGVVDQSFAGSAIGRCEIFILSIGFPYYNDNVTVGDCIRLVQKIEPIFGADLTSAGMQQYKSVLFGSGEGGEFKWTPRPKYTQAP
jgi:hypothetical protein